MPLTCAYTHIRMLTNLHTYIHTYIRTHTHTHTHIYIYIYIYIHTYNHNHINPVTYPLLVLLFLFLILYPCPSLISTSYSICALGNKKNDIDVVYTPWSNLKKTASMDVGQVGFKEDRLVRGCSCRAVYLAPLSIDAYIFDGCMRTLVHSHVDVEILPLSIFLFSFLFQ